MIMKRQVSICIFLAILVIGLALLYIKLNNENVRTPIENDTEKVENATEENTQSITSSNEYVTYYFYAKDDNGRISIYDVQSQTLYMETGIETSLLSVEMQEKLKSGIYFKTEVELFDFLESYSS